MRRKKCEECGRAFLTRNSRRLLCKRCAAERKKARSFENGRKLPMAIRKALAELAGRPGKVSDKDQQRNWLLVAKRFPDSVFAKILLTGEEDGFQPKPCSTPTAARPGSREKIEILAARVLAGEELWHEDDAQPANANNQYPAQNASHWEPF